MMKKLLFENLGLKLLALVFACVVWFLVVNVNNPVITKTISGIQVEITNAEYVESLGLSASASDAGTVSVTLSGNRSEIEPLTKENVSAIADLTQIISLDADPIMVPVKVTVNGMDNLNASVYPGNVKISLEQTVSETFIVTPSTQGTTPANTNYEVGRLDASRESITITGPKSMIGIIDKVIAPVDARNLISDTTVQSQLEIYDKNGVRLTDTEMSSLKFPDGGDSVLVTVNIWDVKKDVILSASTVGTPASGYKVGDIKVTPSTINLTGTPGALSEISGNGNVFEIDPSFLDVSGLKKNVEIKVDLTEMMGDDIRVAEGGNSTVIVSVSIVPQDSRVFTIPVTSIRQDNLQEGNAAVFSIDSVKVLVRGDDDDLANLSESDIILSIDLGNKSAGTYENEAVTVSLPDGCSLVEPISINYDVVVTQNQ